MFAVRGSSVSDVILLDKVNRNRISHMVIKINTNPVCAPRRGQRSHFCSLHFLSFLPPSLSWRTTATLSKNALFLFKRTLENVKCRTQKYCLFPDLEGRKGYLKHSPDLTAQNFELSFTALMSIISGSTLHRAKVTSNLHLLLETSKTIGI